MSIEVIKAGIADTFQDRGRFGHQHLGVNPNGAMDLVAMNVANALVGNDSNEAVLEICFPSPVLLFKKSVLIALSGANFNAQINGKPIPPNQPVHIPASGELKFMKAEKGVFSYLAVRGGFGIKSWMGSFSTNVKAKAGGWEGRSLKKGDAFEFKKTSTPIDEVKILPWRANVSDFYSDENIIRVTPGNEFDWLDEKSKKKFLTKSFSMTSLRDRMGYRLMGEPLSRNSEELVSTAATFGTIQLLPDGQLIILMADHQTTGGYPRVAQVIMTDRSNLVQCMAGEEISFREVSLQQAEDLAIHQHKKLKQIQVTCKARLNDYLQGS